jgi:hypothetical protein
MLAQPELLLALAFSVSGLMIVAALVLLRIGARPSRRPDRVAAPSSGGLGVPPEGIRRPERCETLQLFSGATAATLEQVTRSNPARKRQRMYA